jgi:hypothetical protein
LKPRLACAGTRGRPASEKKCSELIERDGIARGLTG